MEKRIFYHDTDSGGVVYYANYLKYLEEARTLFLESKGIKVGDILYAVRNCNISYKSPARYGDTLTCETALTKVTAVQMIFDQKIFEKATKRLLVEATVNIVSLSKDFKPKPISDEIREMIQK